LAELALGRFVYGKWPHLASAYISGISVGILVKSPDLWPYVMCALISIVSKYALRVRGRHLWNPSNFGITVLLALGGNQMSSLSVQSGNDIWPVVLIWVLGGLILYKLRRLHIPVAFLAAFIPLSYLRHRITGYEFWTELAPMTWPMFQLYIFFMITDPRTTTKARWSQCAVAVLVAVVETIFQLGFRDPHSLYHALFTVGPITNLIEIVWDGRRAAAKQRETAAVAAVPAAGKA
jgi:Na+-transporting NADH:ubiquinone oxidoreductase subunit NqrB